MKKQQKSFIHTLLAEGETNTISSKRLVMVIALIVLIILSILSAFGYDCSPEYSYIFGSLVATESGLTVIEKIKKTAGSNTHVSGRNKCQV